MKMYGRVLKSDSQFVMLAQVTAGAYVWLHNLCIMAISSIWRQVLLNFYMQKYELEVLPDLL